MHCFCIFAACAIKSNTDFDQGHTVNTQFSYLCDVQHLCIERHTNRRTVAHTPMEFNNTLDNSIKTSQSQRVVVLPPKFAPTTQNSTGPMPKPVCSNCAHKIGLTQSVASCRLCGLKAHINCIASSAITESVINDALIASTPLLYACDSCRKLVGEKKFTSEVQPTSTSKEELEHLKPEM